MSASAGHAPGGPAAVGVVGDATSGVSGDAARPVFPLAAVVAQGFLVEALLVGAVDPGLGGVLVRGDRGTAKSTTVRSLAALLPAGPLVEVPIGTSLDRLVGALDVGRALAGQAVYEAGLLARADGGLLYVDEVNLLPDHLVDALLDAAASGVCRVERDGVSVVRDARFLLVGTMNAEEGELRPQLLDRFGLGVDVTTPTDAATRAEIVRRRLAFEADPAGFVARWAGDETALRDRIAAARAALPTVRLDERALSQIVGACATLALDGVRGDIVCARAARALAAWEGAAEVSSEHVRRAAHLALAHRRRRDPLAPPGDGAQDIDDAVAAAGGAGPGPGDDDPSPPPPPSTGAGDGSPAPPGHVGRNCHGERDPGAGGTPDPGASSAPTSEGSPTPPGHVGRNCHSERDSGGGVPDPQRAALRAQLALAGTGAGPAGRRGRGAGPQAGVVDARPHAPGDDVALVPTLLARRATPQVTLDGTVPANVPAAAGAAARGALRAPVRAGREGALLVLVADTSGSMAARARLARVKGALLDVVRDAYARRDRLALIAFRDASATVLAAPGAPPERVAAAIRDLPAGGRTPLAAGLHAAADLVAAEHARAPDRRAICVVLTDGRTTEPPAHVRDAAAALGRVADVVHVVDTEDGAVRLDLAAGVAAAAGAALTTLTTTPSRPTGTTARSAA